MGLDPHQPTVWLVEGLAVYLDAADVGRLLDQVTILSAPGSQLLADIVGQSLLDSPWMKPWLTQLAARGMTGGSAPTSPKTSSPAAAGNPRSPRSPPPAPP